VGCFLFLPGRARGPTTRRPTPTHTIYYSALVGGGRRPFGPHLAAAKVSHTLSAEHVGRGGCPKWVVFCSSQAGRVVQPRGAQRQPTLFTIPRWLAGGAAHLDHTLPPRRSPTPCLLNSSPEHALHTFSAGPGPPQHDLHTFVCWSQARPGMFCIRFWLARGPPQHVLHTFLFCPGPPQHALHTFFGWSGAPGRS
jgi:hypothetical protein